MNGFSLEFDFQVKNFNFINEIVERGSLQTRPGMLIHATVQWTISHLKNQLISSTERKFFFHFQLNISPNIATINLDGSCVFETQDSNSQSQVDYILIEIPNGLESKILNPFILRYSYEHSVNLIKMAGITIPLPPVNEVLKQLNPKSKKDLKNQIKRKTAKKIKKSAKKS